MGRAGGTLGAGLGTTALEDHNVQGLLCQIIFTHFAAFQTLQKQKVLCLCNPNPGVSRPF